MCCFLCLECSSQDWLVTSQISALSWRSLVFLCNPTTMGSPRNLYLRTVSFALMIIGSSAFEYFQYLPSSVSCRRPVFHSSTCLLAVTTQSVFLMTSHRSLVYNPHLLKASSSFKTLLSHYPLCDTSLSYTIKSWSVGLPSHHFIAPVPELIIAAVTVFYNC